VTDHRAVALPASPKKGKEEKGVAKGKKPDSESIAEEHKGPPPPHPGSDEWQFVDRPIDLARCVSFLVVVVS